MIGGRVVLVTGGASGLGAATARWAAAQGAGVALLDQAGSGGADVAASIGPNALFAAVDVCAADEVDRAIREVVGRFGRLDVCVNCAGVAAYAPVLTPGGEMFPLATYRRNIEVNLIGLFDVVRHSAHHMAHNTPDGGGERGVIVNVASIAASDGRRGQVGYAASKGGVAAMTLPLARDLASFGIRVITVSPGVFDTPMVGTAVAAGVDVARSHVFPRRPGHPEEFARLVGAIIDNPMLNGEVIRLDAAARLT